jgi:hypothetical protein
MGVASCAARLTMLTAYKLDLEFAVQMISQKRMVLAYNAQGATEDYADLAAEFQLLDKKLDLEQQNLETQSKAVNSEYESTEKALNANVKSFAYNFSI